MERKETHYGSKMFPVGSLASGKEMWNYLGKRRGLRELLRQEAWSERWKQGRKNRSGEDLGGRTGGELERKSWLEGEI